MVWERSTLRITGRDTAQSERILVRFVDTSPLDSRLHQSRKRVFPRHPCFELVLSCCLCQCCTHNSLFLLSPYFAHGSGAPGYSVLIHGSTSCRQVMSCLRDWSISRMIGKTTIRVSGTGVGSGPTTHPAVIYPQEAVHLPRHSQVKRRDGQRGNSRSRRSRVQRIRG